MFELFGFFHLLWHVVMIPVHLVITLVKYLIVAPIVLILTLLVLIFICGALLVPDTLHLSPVTVVIDALSSQVQVGISPKPLPAQVSCDVQGQAVVVTWVGPKSDEVQWYQVLRKPLADTTWRRIAIVPTSASGQFIYGDTTAEHGVTYQYGVVAIMGNGSESERVISPVQVVAP